MDALWVFFFEYAVNARVLCYSGTEVFDGIIMAPFVDAGLVLYHVFCRSSANPVVAKQVELQYFFSNGNKVGIAPEECEIIPYQLPSSEASSVPDSFQVKKEFSHGSRVKFLGFCLRLFLVSFFHFIEVLVLFNVQTVECKCSKKEILASERKKIQQKK